MPDVPLIVTSSAGDEYIAAEVTRLGAARYLRKDDITPERLGRGHRPMRVRRRRTRPRGAAGPAAAGTRAARDPHAPRACRCCTRVVRGLLTKEIATELGCAEGTVKIHRSHIMEKSGARLARGRGPDGARDRACTRATRRLDAPPAAG